MTTKLDIWAGVAPIASEGTFQCNLCDAFPYDRMADLVDHVESVHHDSPSGTIVATVAPTTSITAATRRADHYTEKQDSFLRRLLSERTGNPEAEAVRANLNRYRSTDGYVTKAAASGAIDALLKIRANGANGQQGFHEAPTTAATVAPGRYAVDSDNGDTMFVKVDHGREGTKWEGRVFVVRLLGAPGDFREVRLPREVSAAVLSTIASNPEAASVRFGQEVGVCGRCGSPLTDATSRARGIGPVCFEKPW